MINILTDTQEGIFSLDYMIGWYEDVNLERSDGHSILIINENAPYSLQASVVDGNAILSWQAPANISEISGYNIFRDDQLINEGLVMDTIFVDENPINGLHTYSLCSLYDDGTDYWAPSELTIFIGNSLYVSPEGDNANNGLSFDNAFKTISYAIAYFPPDSLQPRTIYLASGLYSSESNGETFPIILKDFISIQGAGEELTILDANHQSGILQFDNVNNLSVSGMTVTNGYSYYGGAIISWNSNPTIENLFIYNNEAYESKGGGIALYESNPNIENVIISENIALHGGGISCASSNPNFVNVTVSNNSANSNGGGLYCENSNPIFEIENRSNIYSNNAGKGQDFYSNQFLEIAIDTFSVPFPTGFYIHPIENFSIDILNSIITPVNADIFVSPYGDNFNSGLTSDDPIRNINTALSIMQSDSLEAHTIYLASGVYSPTFNNEYFPIRPVDNINIQGSGEDITLFDAENNSGVFEYFNIQNSYLADMTIIGGSTLQGGGIYCNNSNPIISNLSLSNNLSTESGGGIFCTSSDPTLSNVKIINNNSSYYGGGVCCENSNPIFTKVTIINNSSNMHGGGMYFNNSNPVLNDVSICDNLANSSGGGVYCTNTSNPIIINATITDNLANNTGGGIFCRLNSNPEIINSILWNDIPQEIAFHNINNSSSILIDHSNILGGEDGIVTNDNGEVFWMDGNIDFDPHFIGEFDNPYSLSIFSPCIDTGTPDTTGLNLSEFDILGNPRIWDGDEDGIAVIDMGAYEFWDSEPVLGDINQDGILDILDVVQIVQCVMGEQVESCELGDVNGDEIVDILDIVQILNIILTIEPVLSRGISECQIQKSSDQLTISPPGSIAGVQLNVRGDFVITKQNLPSNWQFHSNESKILFFSADGSALMDDLIFEYNGELNIEETIVADRSGQSITTTIIVYSLQPAYPNPFNPKTTIRYELPRTDVVTISVYDLNGRLVERLMNAPQQAGRHQISWDAGRFASGVYLVKMQSSDFQSVQKVMLMK